MPVEATWLRGIQSKLQVIPCLPDVDSRPTTELDAGAPPFWIFNILRYLGDAVLQTDDSDRVGVGLAENRS